MLIPRELLRTAPPLRNTVPAESTSIPSPAEPSIVEELNVIMPFASTFAVDDPSISRLLPTALAPLCTHKACTPPEIVRLSSVTPAPPIPRTGLLDAAGAWRPSLDEAPCNVTL